MKHLERKEMNSVKGGMFFLLLTLPAATNQTPAPSGKTGKVAGKVGGAAGKVGNVAGK